MFLRPDLDDVRFHYFRDILSWEDAFKREIEGLLWSIHGAGLLTVKNGEKFRPVLHHLHQLALVYKVEDIPPGFNSIISRPREDKSRMAELKRTTIEHLLDNETASQWGHLNTVSRIIDDESATLLKEKIPPNGLYRINGADFFGEIALAPFGYHLSTDPRPAEERAMDVPRIVEQCISRIRSGQDSILGIRLCLKQFRTALDRDHFTTSDLIQFCLVTDLLYSAVEIKQVNERVTCIIDPVLTQLGHVLLLATVGVYNVSYC